MGQEHKEYTWNLIAKKLTGEASPEELRELEELLRNNPELHYPMQTISDLWSPTNITDQQIAEQAFNRHLDRMQDLKVNYHPAPEERRRLKYRTTLLAACAIIAITITGLYLLRPAAPVASPALSQTPAPAGSEIFTGNGSRTHLTLPDGTLVWLNAGSRINYEKNFNATQRSVSLTGEAFFDVAPNANKPFVIHTAHIDIRVLGTSFNIKSYPSDKTTEATLIKGSIEVSIHNRNSKKFILKPNQKLVVTNEDSVQLEKQRPHPAGPQIDRTIAVILKPTIEQHSGAIIETSWVDNKLIFQDEEFVELARQMERWYGVTIRFEGDGNKDLRFTGIFEKETIEQALEALKLTANFDYTVEGTQITIHD